MNTKQSAKSVPSIEQQLASVNLPDHVRDAVPHYAQVAEQIADAIIWVAGKLGRLGGRAFTKLSPKY